MIIMRKTIYLIPVLLCLTSPVQAAWNSAYAGVWIEDLDNSSLGFNFGTADAPAVISGLMNKHGRVSLVFAPIFQNPSSKVVHELNGLIQVERTPPKLEMRVGDEVFELSAARCRWSLQYKLPSGIITNRIGCEAFKRVTPFSPDVIRRVGRIEFRLLGFEIFGHEPHWVEAELK